jgi:HK97 family phage major capsid protein
MPTKLRELQERLWSKQDVFKRIMEQSRLSDGSYDFTKADSFEHLDSQKACIEQLESMEKEMDDIAAEVRTLEGIQAQEARLKEKLEHRRMITEPMVHPVGNGNGQYATNGMLPAVKTLSDYVRETYPRDIQATSGIVFDREYKALELKALMYTGSGFLPETSRIPRIQEQAFRPIQVVDLFPVGTTDQPQIQYMLEQGSVSGAREELEAGVAGSGAWQESTLIYTEQTVTIRKIATWLPVSDEQLADVSQMAGLIDARLRFFAMQRLDNQIINGDGTAPNMRGILNTAGVLTQARGADPIPDAIYKAMVQVRVTGRATPTAVLINPTNFQDVRLLRTADGMYIWGHPSVPGPMTMWGVPVVEADVISAGTALVGDFAAMSQLWTRQGVQVESGFINDDFVKGRQAIRVTVRAVIVVYRPAAFAKITGL